MNSVGNNFYKGGNFITHKSDTQPTCWCQNICNSIEELDKAIKKQSEQNLSVTQKNHNNTDVNYWIQRSYRLNREIANQMMDIKKQIEDLKGVQESGNYKETVTDKFVSLIIGLANVDGLIYKKTDVDKWLVMADCQEKSESNPDVDIAREESYVQMKKRAEVLEELRDKIGICVSRAMGKIGETDRKENYSGGICDRMLIAYFEGRLPGQKMDDPSYTSGVGLEDETQPIEQLFGEPYYAANEEQRQSEIHSTVPVVRKNIVKITNNSSNQQNNKKLKQPQDTKQPRDKNNHKTQKKPTDRQTKKVIKTNKATTTMPKKKVGLKK